MVGGVGAAVDVVTVRLWEVTHHQPVSVPQVTMAMGFWQQALHRSGLVAAPSDPSTCTSTSGTSWRCPTWEPCWRKGASSG